MKSIMTILLAAGMGAARTISADAGEQPISQETLIQGMQSWDGSTFAYPGGQAELAVVRIKVSDGTRLPWHCHPSPLAGVLTQGELEVSKPNGERMVLQRGEALIEVSKLWHRGEARGDVEILVVYAGSAGLPLSVGQEAEPEQLALCEPWPDSAQ